MDYIKTVRILVGKMLHGLNGLLSGLSLFLWLMPALIPQLSGYFKNLGQPHNLFYVSGFFAVISILRSIHEIRMENGGLFSSRTPVVEVSFDVQNRQCISYVGNVDPSGTVAYTGTVCLSIKSKVSRLRDVKIRIREKTSKYPRELGHLNCVGGHEGKTSLNLSEGEVAFFQLASVWTDLQVPIEQVRGNREVSSSQIEVYLKHAREKGLLIEVPSTLISEKPNVFPGSEMSFFVDVYFENAHSVVAEVDISGPPDVKVRTSSTKVVPKVA